MTVLGKFEFGIYTFGEMLPDPFTGKTISAAERIENIIASAQLADKLGLDVYGLGEHHRLDFAVSAPPVVLAAIASTTKNIRLTTTTTVLGTADPVRVFEDFATLDLISKGRAEMIAGRGAFIESFPLFGYSLDDYPQLFDEKLQLLHALNEKERVTWEGQFRSALHNNDIAPRPYQEKLPIWRGVGGTPSSAVQAGRDGMHMALAMLGGHAHYAKPLIEAYRQGGFDAGHTPQQLKVAITSHGFIGETTEQAVKKFTPYYARYVKVMLRRMITEDYVKSSTTEDNALAIGSPQDIIDKILYQHRLFKHDRFLLQIDICQPFEDVMRSIELFATEVVPGVRKGLGEE